MRIKITKGGIYGAKGEIEIGTEMTVKEEPTGWAGRYEVIGDDKGKTPVTNAPEPKTAAEALALFSANDVHVNTAKAAALKFLGDQVPADADKATIVTKLEDLAKAES